MSHRHRADRRVAAAAIPLVALLVLTACGSADAPPSTADPSKAQLVMADYGGTLSSVMKTAFLDAYSQETGAKFTQDLSMDNNKIAIQVESGNVQWDLAEVDAFIANQQCGKQFEELDAATLEPSKFAPGRVTNKCGVPILSWGGVLAYDKTKFGDNPPTTWADFFDTKKYPGKRCAPQLARYSLEAGLLGDGVDPKQLYPMDVSRAISKWQGIRSDTAFLTSSTQQVDTMISGGAVMCLAYSGRVYDAVKQGANWEVSWPTVLHNWDNLVILKGSQNTADAKAFLAWLSDHPEAQTKLAELYPYASTAAESDPQVSPEQADFLLSNHRDEGVVLDHEWYAQNNDAAESAWQASLIG